MLHFYDGLSSVRYRPNFFSLKSKGVRCSSSDKNDRPNFPSNQRGDTLFVIHHKKRANKSFFLNSIKFHKTTKVREFRFDTSYSRFQHHIHQAFVVNKTRRGNTFFLQHRIFDILFHKRRLYLIICAQ